MSQIQLVPSETLDQEPNPVTTSELQDKLTRHVFNMTVFNRSMQRSRSVSTEINDVRKIDQHAIQVITITVESRYFERRRVVALNTILHRQKWSGC